MRKLAPPPPLHNMPTFLPVFSTYAGCKYSNDGNSVQIIASILLGDQNLAKFVFAVITYLTNLMLKCVGVFFHGVYNVECELKYILFLKQLWILIVVYARYNLQTVHNCP